MRYIVHKALVNEDGTFFIYYEDIIDYFAFYGVPE